MEIQDSGCIRSKFLLGVVSEPDQFVQGSINGMSQTFDFVFHGLLRDFSFRHVTFDGVEDEGPTDRNSR